MQISQNSTTFDGSFKIAKLSRSRKEFLRKYSVDKNSIYYDNLGRSGLKFISVPDKNDRALLELLNRGNAIYTYYPQIRIPDIKKKTEKQIIGIMNEIIPSRENVLKILKLLEIRIQNPDISEYLHGTTMVRNHYNNDIVLISPKNSYGTNYVKFIPGISQSEGSLTKRYAIKAGDEVKPINDILSFSQKYKSTFITEGRG